MSRLDAVTTTIRESRPPGRPVDERRWVRSTVATPEIMEVWRGASQEVRLTGCHLVIRQKRRRPVHCTGKWIDEPLSFRLSSSQTKHYKTRQSRSCPSLQIAGSIRPTPRLTFQTHVTSNSRGQHLPTLGCHVSLVCPSRQDITWRWRTTRLSLAKSTISNDRRETRHWRPSRITWRTWRCCGRRATIGTPSGPGSRPGAAS